MIGHITSALDKRRAMNAGLSVLSFGANQS